MLVQFHEQTVDDFLIPSFALKKGEIVIVQLPNGPFFHPLELALIDIITGKTVNEKVEIISPLRYVEHVKESWFRYHFLPITVGTYLDKYANKANPVYKKIYDIKWMTPKTKVQALAGNPRRQLSLYTTLSWTSDIIFDLAGVDPQGGQDIYNFVKTVVQSGGSAILFDYSDEFKNDCTAFIQVQYLGGK
ncbi:hypothetical protein HB364_17695 [Pseudoflavitalea sp. X16]|uniref:hypothetical protein n=1 Tax=Paraflavitalea devenefica TaxID=2716334 RepID=UPI001420767F|nr:hypothetical protein [Paraflavitalea devenefica]NII26928.1 hypothetical protein [Paraflavitalea devenefica]